MRSIVAAKRVVPAAFVIVFATRALAAPVVALSPTIDHPQGATRVSGSGFAVNEAVDIFYDTTDVVLEVTDAAGKFGADKIAIPANALPGEHWITAIGRKSGDAAHKKLIVSTAWVSHGFNERGRRRNPYENVVNSGNVSRLDVAWSFATSLGIESSPAVSQVSANAYTPTVFIGTNDAHLYAFDLNGAQKWAASTGSGVLASSPAVANGNVYVGAANGNVLAFKATNGAPAWPAPAHIGGAVSASPAVLDGIVYIASQSTFFALHGSDGTQVWHTSIPAGGSFFDSAPAVASGIVYAGASDHNLYAFHTADGSAAWSSPFATGDLIDSSPAIANGVVYVGSEDGKLYAVNAKTGVAAWSAPALTGGSIDSSPAVAGGIVYVGARDSKLYAFNANTGAGVWSGLTGGPIGLSSPAVANGVVYVGSEDKRLYAFPTTCASTCSPLWSAVTGDQIQGSPTVVDGMVFVGSLDHSFYTFALDAGNAAVYRQKSAQPPAYATLHPDFRLKPVKHGG